MSAGKLMQTGLAFVLSQATAWFCVIALTLVVKFVREISAWFERCSSKAKKSWNEKSLTFTSIENMVLALLPRSPERRLPDFNETSNNETIYVSLLRCEALLKFSNVSAKYEMVLVWPFDDGCRCCWKFDLSKPQQ